MVAKLGAALDICSVEYVVHDVMITRKSERLHAIALGLVTCSLGLYSLDKASMLGEQAPRLVARSVMTIGAGVNQIMLGIQGFSVLESHSIVVSDKLERTLKRIDAKGNLIGERRFCRDPRYKAWAPGPCATWHDVLAVARFATSKIVILDTLLQYRNEILAPGPIADLKFDPNGGLWVSCFTGDKNREVFKLKVTGEVMRSVALRNTTGDMFDDVVVLALNSKGQLAVAYMTRNLVEIWDTSGHFKRQMSISRLPTRSPRQPYRLMISQKELQVPEGEVIRSIALDDSGNIFVLGGSLADCPEQLVIVVSSEGKYLGYFRTEGMSYMIAIQREGLLYSVENERTQIRVYSISPL